MTDKITITIGRDILEHTVVALEYAYNSNDVLIAESIKFLRHALAGPPSMQPLPNHDNHHNALKCPYCNPRGLVFAEPTAPQAWRPDIGEVVVTRNDAGEIVAVTRQDDEGRILSVIAEAQPSPARELVAWKHDCAGLCANDVELWLDACPHCGKPRTTPPAQPAHTDGLAAEVWAIAQSPAPMADVLPVIAAALWASQPTEQALQKIADFGQDQEPVAWLRIQEHENRPTTIHLCDSDHPKAFKVYATRPQPASSQAKSLALLDLDSVEHMQGGANGPTIRLRGFINAQTGPTAPQPPIDNAFVAEGCEQFSPPSEPAPVPCCGKYETCSHACTPRGKWLGRREAESERAIVPPGYAACSYPHCSGEAPEDRSCCRLPFTSAMADAAEQYWRSVGRFAHPLPAEFRWVDCFNAMIAAAKTPHDARR